MTQVSRREFLGGLALAAPVIRQAAQPPARTFAWVNDAPDKYPAGIRHGTFKSASNRTEVGYCIFLPPGYDATENNAKRYPVVYWLHGGFPGSELLGIQMAPVLDREMRAGETPPVIYVFPNGGRISHYDYPPLDSYGETALVRELIPHVDKTYRTIARRESRALEGFSAGGRGTARIMFKYPELFCCAAPISGGHQHEKYISEHNGQSQVPPDVVFEPGNNTYDLARKYASASTPRLNILVVVGTEDANYQPNLDWMAHLQSLGIEHEKILVEDAGHNMTVFTRAGAQIRQFHAKNFGRS